MSDNVADLGGMERYVQNVTRALVRRGVQTLIVGKHVVDSSRYASEAVEIPWSDDHDTPSTEAALRLSALIGTFQPSVVIAHNVVDAEILRAARATSRFIYHVHDHRPFCLNGNRVYPQGGGICALRMGMACLAHSVVSGCASGPRMRTVHLLRARESVRNRIATADAIITLSKFMASIACGNGLPTDRIHVVAPPLPGQAFGLEPSERPENIVLFAGRISPLKGLSSLVRAIARIRLEQRPMLTVAGDGPSRALDLDEARRRGVTVNWLGACNDAALHQAIDRARIVAVPSVLPEPFGLVGIEAMSRGRPVVAYDVGGISEWMHRGGAIVTSGDETALAKAIVALSEPDRWIEAARSAWSRARDYTESAIVDKICSIYQ